MRSRYINYGAIPVNEYKKSNVAEMPDDSPVQKKVPVRRVVRPTQNGWQRSWKANGWRADLASRQDGQMNGRNRYYVRKER